MGHIGIIHVVQDAGLITSGCEVAPALHEAFCSRDRRMRGMATHSDGAYRANDWRRQIKGAGESAGAIPDG